MADLITLPRATVRQALEALEDLLVWHSKNSMAITVIAALKAALEQPEQEPVAWNSVGATSLEFETECLDGTRFLNVAEMPSHAVRWRIVAPPRRETEQPEQEPGSVCARCGGWVCDPVIPQQEQEPLAIATVDESLGVVFKFSRSHTLLPGQMLYVYTHPPRRETEPAFDALVAISLLTHLGGEVAEYADVVESVRRLHALNEELLGALRRMADPRNIHFAGDAQVVARAAIARAEGKV
jgi:hypothetical protein